MMRRVLMELETKRLRVIPCTEEVVQSAIKQQYEIGPHIPAHLQELKEDPSLLYWGVWLVVRKTDGLIIGDIGFKGKPNEAKIVEVGYGFLEDTWNNGYATEAVGALIHWATQTKMVKKIVAETLHQNYGSIRVLEKLNMKKIDETGMMIKWQLGE